MELLSVPSINSAVTENGVLGIVNRTILDDLIPGSGRGKHPIACQDSGICEDPASNPMRDPERSRGSAAEPIAQAAPSIGTGGV